MSNSTSKGSVGGVALVCAWARGGGRLVSGAANTGVDVGAGMIAEVGREANSSTPMATDALVRAVDADEEAIAAGAVAELDT